MSDVHCQTSCILVDLDSKFVDPDETFKDYMDKIMKGEIESNSIVQGCFDATYRKYLETVK